MVVGIFLVALGILLLFLPGQGILTIFAGLYVLFPEDTRIGRKIRTWVRNRRAAVHRQLEERRQKRGRTSRPF